MTIIEFAPRPDRGGESLQRKALDEISHKFMVAQNACRAVCELLEAMAELAELIDQLADYPAPGLGTRVNLASMRVESKLAALDLHHGQLSRLRGRP